jgi:hypothetical protein
MGLTYLPTERLGAECNMKNLTPFFIPTKLISERFKPKTFDGPKSKIAVALIAGAGFSHQAGAEIVYGNPGGSIDLNGAAAGVSLTVEGPGSVSLESLGAGENFNIYVDSTRIDAIAGLAQANVPAGTHTLNAANYGGSNLGPDMEYDLNYVRETTNENPSFGTITADKTEVYPGQPVTFEIAVTNNEGDETLTVGNLPDGIYTLTETPAGYTLTVDSTGFAVAGSIAPTLEITDGKNQYDEPDGLNDDTANAPSVAVIAAPTFAGGAAHPVPAAGPLALAIPTLLAGLYGLVPGFRRRANGIARRAGIIHPANPGV